jgi:hypothetical protein
MRPSIASGGQSRPPISHLVRSVARSPRSDQHERLLTREAHGEPVRDFRALARLTAACGRAPPWKSAYCVVAKLTFGTLKRTAEAPPLGRRLVERADEVIE